MPARPAFAAAMILVPLCVGAGPVAAGGPTARSVTLAAIHRLENPRNLTRPGPRGELGPYQFRESTWRAYTDEPFDRAVDADLSRAIAARHYDWLRQRLESSGVPPTTYNIALAWNGGITAVLLGHAPRAAHDYAQRAVNLVAVYADELTRAP